jgi:hypothetical protein
VSYIDYIVNVKKSPCDKPLVQFQPNLAGLILGYRASKVVQIILFHAEIWLPWQTKGILRINYKKSSCKDPQGLKHR